MKIKDLADRGFLSPKYEHVSYLIYENGYVIATLEVEELVKTYGKFKAQSIDEPLPYVDTKEPVKIHVIPPDALWFDTEEEIECVGFTDTADNGSPNIEGFFTYCVGNSYEAGFIYVDISFTLKVGWDEPEIHILPRKEDFAGRGFRDIPVRVPEDILEKLLQMTKKKENIFFLPDKMEEKE